MKDKKKIALVVDADNWAFANIAKNVSKRLKNKYDFTIIPTAYFNDNLATALIVADDCDLVHFFWRGKLTALDYYDFDQYVNSLGFSREEFLEKFFNHKHITTAVYDHLYSEGENDLKVTRSIIDKCQDYYVSSNRLLNIYNSLDLPKKAYGTITDGVDLNKFFPINLARFDDIESRPIKIGWVGNSAWEKDKEDFKGVNTILKPAVEELIEEGYNLEMYFAD